jgi:hypothetical protein
MSNGFAFFMAPPVTGWPMSLAEQRSSFGPAPLQSPHPYELLRPCAPHWYSDPCGLCHLDVSLGIGGATGSHVPHMSLVELRAANIAEMVKRLRAHDIRVIVFDPKIPEDLYQWDHIHFNVAAHANIAARLAAEIAAEPLARPATPIATHPASTRQP